MSGSIHFELTLGDEPALMIDARIASADAFEVFANAVNGVREALWPSPDDDAGSGDVGEAAEEGAQGEDTRESAEIALPRRSREALNVIPGARLHDTLELLRRGVVDPVAIADELDVKTNVAASFKARLIKSGHWSSDAGSADADRETHEEA